MSKIVTKASEISNLTDARYFSACGVDWLGFSLDSNNENYLPPIQIIAIREWISGPKITFELGAILDFDSIAATFEALKPDAVQIGPLISKEITDKFIPIPVIRELIPDSLEQVQDYTYEWRIWDNAVSFFFINFEKNSFSWEDIKRNESALSSLIQLCKNYNVMLSMVFDYTALDEIISVLNPYGFSFKGGAEEKVGMKSFEALDLIFETLENLSQ